MWVDISEIIKGNYLKTFDGSWVRMKSIDIVYVTPMKDRWIIALIVNGGFINLSELESEQEAIKSMDNLLTLLSRH